MDALWAELDQADLPEEVRLALFEQASTGLQMHIADLLRCTSPDMAPGEIVALLTPGLEKLEAMVDDLLRPEARSEASGLRAELDAIGAPPDIAHKIVRLFELNGAVGLAVLGQKLKVDEVQLTRAYTKLGEALGLDWAQHAANNFQARDQWERLLTAGLARDFEQLRLEFLERRKSDDPKAIVDKWVTSQGPRIEQFRRTVERARTAPATTAPMLAQIATQARVLLGR
jgi:glutamate dehydrogenase